MSNYLPVLLVSVAANSIPDDSAVSTLPRGQVDYLSHNWEEEDVWRSWRNMTRQKNEIANGVRLENASWRTWWKQRNGLGTVTPETLNWLKDSDVTWLYGPLHTAVDWAPPPKPVQSTVNSSALDLSSSTHHKPILKHRSISQLLTSDLPLSPVFSPSESDDDDFSHPSAHLPDEPGGSRRPTLTHTKSDTHISRWGPNRAFRKESPPRIDPPTHSPSELGAASSPSNSNQSSDGTAPASSHRNTSKKRHISFNTFVEQCIAIDKPKKLSGYTEDDEGGEVDEDEDGDDYIHRNVAGRYRYGRNAWGYDDGYEEDAEEESDEDSVTLPMWDEGYMAPRGLSGSDSDSYEDGVGEEEGQAEEDEGDGVLGVRPPFKNHTKSTSPRSQSTASTASTSSSASTSTSISNSTSSTSDSPDRRNPQKPSRRRLSTSTTSTYRPNFTAGGTRHDVPPLSRKPSGRPNATSPPPQTTHVTIAPIAPTILKTGNHYYGHHPGGWSEGFGDEGGSDDGLWGGNNASRWWGSGVPKGKGKGEDSDGSGGQTPVELVYVPLGNNYSYNMRANREREREQRAFAKECEREREREARDRQSGKMVTNDVMEDHEDGFGNGDQDVYRRRATLFRVGDDDGDIDAEDLDATITSRGVHLRVPIPTVIIRHDAQSEYGRPGMSEDLTSRRSSSSSLSLGGRSGSIDLSRGRGASSNTPGSRGESYERSRSRTRSRSRSRTPSPAMITPSTNLNADGAPAPSVPNPTPTPGPGHTHGPVIIPPRRSASTSPTKVSSSLLSPPPRGRASHSYQDIGQANQRGRSSARTTSSCSDRERSTGTNSLGSLSPEGLDVGNVAVAYTGGRHEREKKGDRDRERPRGRERTESRRANSGGYSPSPEGVQDSLLRVSPASTTPVLPPSAPVLAPRLEVATTKAKAPASTVSSSSSSSSRSTSSSMTVVPNSVAEPEPRIPISVPIDVRKAEEHQRHLMPTPSNSPVICMRPVPAAVTAKASPEFPDPSTSQGTYTPKIKPSLAVPAVHPVEPSTSYSISPPRVDLSPPSSPRSPTRGEPTIVGKAVEIVSSAGAFFGFWTA